MNSNNVAETQRNRNEHTDFSRIVSCFQNGQDEQAIELWKAISYSPLVAGEKLSSNLSSSKSNFCLSILKILHKIYSNLKVMC